VVEWVNRYKVEKGCVDCGYNQSPVALDLDHLGDKYKNVSDMIQTGYGLARIMKEVAKCEVRCANCHRIVTQQRAIA
jgi:hypothetical protein